MSKDIPQLGEQTIIFWGADDEILDKESVKRFALDLPRSRYTTSCAIQNLRLCLRHAEKLVRFAVPAH